MRRFVAAAMVAVISCIAIISGTSVMAAPSGGIGGRPANPDPKNPRTNTIFIYTLDHGKTKRDQVIVTNNTDKTQTVELYAVDGVVTNTGAYTCKQEAEARSDIGAWLKLAKSEVTLQSGKSEKVDFILTMPKNADVGEHDGCIVFQAKDSSVEARGNVRIRTRQAVRVVATVPGNLKRDIEIASFTVASLGHTKQLNLKLSNTGNVSADVDTRVHLKTLWGSEYFTDGGGYPVLANEHLDLTFTLSKRPLFGGWYTANADIAYDKRAGTFGTSDPNQLIHRASAQKVIFIAPTAAGALVLLVTLLAIIGVVSWLIWRRHQTSTAKRKWRLYTVYEGDTLESLAQRNHVDWRKLARVNKIRAPYVLKSDTKIRVPAPEPAKRLNVKTSRKG